MIENMHTLRALTAAIEPLQVINNREEAFTGITADSRAVVGGGIFPERYFQFAHTEQAQGFPCHDSSIVVSDIHGGRRRPQTA